MRTNSSKLKIRADAYRRKDKDISAVKNIKNSM